MVEEERSVLGCVRFVCRGEMVSELVGQAFERVCTSTKHHITAPHREPHTASGAGDTTTTHNHSQRHTVTPRRSPDHDDRQRQMFFGGVGQILNPSTILLTDACDGIIG